MKRQTNQLTAETEFSPRFRGFVNNGRKTPGRDLSADNEGGGVLGQFWGRRLVLGAVGVGESAVWRDVRTQAAPALTVLIGRTARRRCAPRRPPKAPGRPGVAAHLFAGVEPVVGSRAERTHNAGVNRRFDGVLMVLRAGNGGCWIICYFVWGCFTVAV